MEEEEDEEEEDTSTRDEVRLNSLEVPLQCNDEVSGHFNHAT